MKTRIYILIALTITGIWMVQSCKKGMEQTQLKAEKLVLPENTDEYFTSEPLLNKQATIGRVLFYDKNLSANNVIACASCHFQENAFADGKQFSSGFKTEMTNRNSMAFNNLGSDNGGLFWDLRERNLQEMVLKPVSNHIEMGFTDIGLICKKLEQFPHYRTLFTEAYSDGFTVKNVANSLKLFLTSIRSDNSKFDIDFVLDRQNYESDFENFTPEENYGKQLFVKRNACMDCHNPFSNFQRGWSNWANIGLDVVSADKGVQPDFFDPFGERTRITEGSFKIPSLRNIALTAPYMHDGRFATLEEVIDHYSDGIKFSTNLDWELTEINSTPGGGFSSGAKRFNYSERDKKALIAFLKTLTDYKMISDPKFSNPFQVAN